MDRNIIPVSEYNQSTSETSNPLTNCPTTCTTFNKSAKDPRLSSYAGSLSSSSSSSSSSLFGFFEIHENHEGEGVRKSSVFTALPHVTDLTTYMIQDIISFSKSLQIFR